MTPNNKAVKGYSGLPFPLTEMPRRNVLVYSVSGKYYSWKLRGKEDIKRAGAFSNPGPFPFVLCAATGRTCGPGGRRLPTQRPRPARTATPRCYRPTAAVPSSPPPLEREPGREPGPGQEPQRAGAAQPEQPSAAGAEEPYTGPWPQHHRPSPL